jgi:hypothetical protein
MPGMSASTTGRYSITAVCHQILVSVWGVGRIAICPAWHDGNSHLHHILVSAPGRMSTTSGISSRRPAIPHWILPAPEQGKRPDGNRGSIVSCSVPRQMTCRVARKIAGQVLPETAPRTPRPVPREMTGRVPRTMSCTVPRPVASTVIVRVARLMTRETAPETTCRSIRRGNPKATQESTGRVTRESRFSGVVSAPKPPNHRILGRYSQLWCSCPACLPPVYEYVDRDQRKRPGEAVET